MFHVDLAASVEALSFYRLCSLIVYFSLYIATVQYILSQNGLNTNFNIDFYCAAQPMLNDFLDLVEYLSLLQSVKEATHLTHSLYLVLSSGLCSESGCLCILQKFYFLKYLYTLLFQNASIITVLHFYCSQIIFAIGLFLL